MSAADERYPDEMPTVPAPASEAERSFEEEIARLGGSWSQRMKTVPVVEEE